MVMFTFNPDTFYFADIYMEQDFNGREEKSVVLIFQIS